MKFQVGMSAKSGVGFLGDTLAYTEVGVSEFMSPEIAGIGGYSRTTSTAFCTCNGPLKCVERLSVRLLLWVGGLLKYRPSDFVVTELR